MRILQMSAYADAVGGAEVYMLNLCEELERRGHVVGRFGTHPEQEVDEPALRVVRRPRWEATRTVRDEEVSEPLRRFVEAFRPDLIHVHNVWSLGLDVDRALRDFHAPVVQTLHDYSTFCPNSWCVLPDGTVCEGGAGAKCFAHGCQENYPYDARTVLTTMARQRLVSAAVDVAISPSEHLARMARRHGYRDVRHVHYFVDATKLVSEPRERRRDTLLFLGRLDPEKGVDYLIDAMPRVLAERPDTRLEIVGAGHAADELAARARRLGIGHAVTFHGKVPYDRVRDFLASATALVLPSIWSENSPVSAYECMVVGLPMLASRIGGIPELVDDGVTGYLFEPRDADDIAQKALALLAATPAEHEAMCARTRARIGMFSREAHMDRVEAIYRELLQRGPGDASPPRMPLDEDFESVLDHLIADLHLHETRTREHVEYIRVLHEGTAALRKGPAQPRREGEPRRGGGRGPWLGALKARVRRVARALGLPKVFR